MQGDAASGDTLEASAAENTDNNKSQDNSAENSSADENKDVNKKDDTDNNKEASAQKEEKNKIIYYVTDQVQQSQYIAMFREAGKDAVILPERIDQPFISELEAKNQGVHFRRIDADLTDEFKAETSEDEEKTLTEKSKALESEIRTATGKDKLNVKLQKMTSQNTAAMLSVSEESRRMNDMMKMYAAQGMQLGEMPVDETLILNTEHPLVKYLMEHEDKADDTSKMICEQVYDLARLQQSPLKADEMTKFIQRSNEILLKLTK